MLPSMTSCFRALGDLRDEPRPLSFHERYANVPVITHHAHSIVYLYRYTSSTIPSTTFLQGRVAHAQQKIHHLWSEVINGETRKPSIQLRAEGPWSSKDIIRDDAYDNSGSGAAGTDGEARLLEQEIDRMRARVSDGGPAWQVTRYFPSSRPSTPLLIHFDVNDPSTFTDPFADSISESPCYIAFSTFHHLMDGTSGLRLSLALLGNYPLLSFPGLAPRMEDVVPLAPSLGFLVKEIYKEFIDPALPSSLRIVKPCWPGLKVSGTPTAFPEAQTTVHLPSSWISALKRAGRVHGVDTLHPIIETALVMALHEVMGRPEETIEVVTPINDRDASNPSHPHIGAIFVSILRKAYTNLDLTPPSSNFFEKGDHQHSHFWSLTQTTADHHASPKARKHSRFAIGMFAHVPNPKRFSSPRDSPDRRTKTGWEEFFWSNIERPAPFRSSFVISNLGRVQALPPGCEGMRWSQSALPFEEALLFCLVGHDWGLELCVGFRDGCAITRSEVERLLARFKELLGRLI